MFVILIVQLFLLTLNTGIVKWRKTTPYIMRQMKPEEERLNWRIDKIVDGLLKYYRKSKPSRLHPQAYLDDILAFCQDWGWWSSLKAQENERLEQEDAEARRAEARLDDEYDNYDFCEEGGY